MILELNPDFSDAQSLLDKCVHQLSLPEVQYNIASQHYFNDVADSVVWYRKAALQGHKEAQYYLAISYYYGLGVPKNKAKAAKWHLEAAKQGYANAQFSLAEQHYNGDGIPENKAKAAKWYHKAARQGHIDAQYSLAEQYYFGEGIPKNEAAVTRGRRKGYSFFLYCGYGKLR